MEEYQSALNEERRKTVKTSNNTKTLRISLVIEKNKKKLAMW